MGYAPRRVTDALPPKEKEGTLCALLNRRLEGAKQMMHLHAAHDVCGRHDRFTGPFGSCLTWPVADRHRLHPPFHKRKKSPFVLGTKDSSPRYHPVWQESGNKVELRGFEPLASSMPLRRSTK